MVINGAIIHLFLKDFYASSEQSIISFLEDPSPKMKKKKKDPYPAESNIHE